MGKELEAASKFASASLIALLWYRCVGAVKGTGDMQHILLSAPFCWVHMMNMNYLRLLVATHHLCHAPTAIVQSFCISMSRSPVWERGLSDWWRNV